ncbi:ABC-three component system protein [Streptomyces roseifaciens]|uniref:ABC-three component system protein n=1 Tax=Streptomyces roseifaciens TaxID=1488406 RepID=UPI000A4FBF3C|nr:ABC-three component system protein [Streptomyces roseifaciens]
MNTGVRMGDGARGVGVDALPQGSGSTGAENVSVSQYAPLPSAVSHNRFDTRTPLQQVFYWTPDQWEQFTCEWVRMRRDELGYLGVEIVGGTNDRGADVVAFMSDQRLNGVWHCYQCKHHSADLTLDDALPEMIKPFVATLETSRTLPTRYTFVAPRIHPRLKDTVLTPAELKKRFLAYMDGRTRPVAALPSATREAVRELAVRTDFSMFWTVNLDEVLEVYSKSQLFASRFNLPPTGEPRKLLPPPVPQGNEARYLQKLLDVYQERFGVDIATVEDAFEHPSSGQHLGRQRVAFFDAESLRMYARESVPGDAYEELQDDVLANLIEVIDMDFPSGWDRLQEVLKASGQLVPTGSPLLTHLVSHFRNSQRKGMCHQLANDDKLTWCKGGCR